MAEPADKQGAAYASLISVLLCCPYESADDQEYPADLHQRQRFPEQDHAKPSSDHRLRVAQQRTAGRADHGYSNKERDHGKGVEESGRNKPNPAGSSMR